MGMNEKTTNKCNWQYEIDLLRDISIIMTVWKIFSLSALFPTIIVMLVELFDGSSIVWILWIPLKMYSIVWGILTVLLLLSYYLVFVPMHRGKYRIIFEMDHNGISHIVANNEMKKARKVAFIGVLVGIFSRSPMVAGSSIIVGSRNSVYTSFDGVTKIVLYRKKNKIILVEDHIARNMIYTAPEDFEAVSRYIIGRCKSEIKKVYK